MKTAFLPAVLLSFLASPVFSQRTLKEIDENKYRISLPDHWKPRNKAFHVLSDVLPALCPELKDKDLCGDNCNPAWTVEFYITEPELLWYEVNSKPSPVNNTNTQFSFVRKDTYISPASPQIRQTGNNPAYRRVPGELAGKEVVSYFNFQCFLLLKDREQKIVTRLILVDTNEVWKKVQSSKTSYNSTGKWSSLLPESEELMTIADKKILALGKAE